MTIYKELAAYIECMVIAWINYLVVFSQPVVAYYFFDAAYGRTFNKLLKSSGMFKWLY